MHKWCWTHTDYNDFLLDLYKLTDEVLGQGAYAKVQGCISHQNGQEFAVKVRKLLFPQRVFSIVFLN